MCLEALKVKRVSLSNIYLSCRDNGIEITFLELALTKGLTIGGHSKWLIPCPLEEIGVGWEGKAKFVQIDKCFLETFAQKVLSKRDALILCINALVSEKVYKKCAIVSNATPYCLGRLHWGAIFPQSLSKQVYLSK